MITVLQMDRVPGDVAINTIAFLDEQTRLRPMYKFVKGRAGVLARKYKNSVVEMTDHLGLPHASVYVNDTIEHQIFAVKE